MVNRMTPPLTRPGSPQGTACLASQVALRRLCLNFVQLMWTVWASLVAMTGTCYFFRVRLNRDEADQISLDGSFEHERVEQETIVAKVTKIESIVK